LTVPNTRPPPEPQPPLDQPLAIAVISREVVFIGPGRVAFSMTRAAAIETHKRLTEVLGLD
jgi:hypothetical protein